MNYEEIKEHERYLDLLKKTVERSEKLEQLEKNELFQEVILDGYLKDELNKLVELQQYYTINATPTTVEFGKVQDALTQKQIEAIGLFKYFLNTVKRQGKEAKETIENMEKESNIQ